MICFKTVMLSSDFIKQRVTKELIHKYLESNNNNKNKILVKQIGT